MLSLIFTRLSLEGIKKDANTLILCKSEAGMTALHITHGGHAGDSLFITIILGCAGWGGAGAGQRVVSCFRQQVNEFQEWRAGGGGSVPTHEIIPAVKSGA